MMRLQEQLTTLAACGQYREIPALQHHGHYLIYQDKALFNTAGNDYLGIAGNSALEQAFWQQIAGQSPAFGSTSSRLLTGNDLPHQQLEESIGQAYHASALLFNSGYHANIGILPALAAAEKPCLILADKLVHASIIDGIRLASCDFKRFQHQDYQHLRQLLARADARYQRIFIVSESIFSMDGDRANLSALVELKKSDSRVQIYLDEAHAVGIYGDSGLGCAQEAGLLAEIDYLVGTFGKAFASVGAFVVCSQQGREYLINSARSLIFSTNLPPINAAWSHFIFSQRNNFAPQRKRLLEISAVLREALGERSGGDTHIVPYFCGENNKALEMAGRLFRHGIYARAIRPPTVPQGTARLRLTLPATTTNDELEKLLRVL